MTSDSLTASFYRDIIEQQKGTSRSTQKCQFRIIYRWSWNREVVGDLQMGILHIKFRTRVMFDNKAIKTGKNMKHMNNEVLQQGCIRY